MDDMIYNYLRELKTLNIRFPKWCMDLRLIIRELVGFTGLSSVTVCKNIRNGRKLIADEWNNVCPTNEEEVTNFYKDTSNYIWDLADWNHCSPTTYLRNFRIVRSLKSKSNILDYGAGIGSLLIMAHERKIQNLTYYDVKGYTSSFAYYRFRLRGMKINMVEANDYIDTLRGTYDSIICLDVLEHVTNQTMHLERLTRHLAKGGKLYLSTAFGKNQTHPMHMNKERDTSEDSLGLQEVDSIEGGVIVFTKRCMEE